MTLAATFAPSAAEPEPRAAATRADDLAQRLADAITSGALPAGTRLDEHTVAARFAVSRTPVREALRQLAAAGLIERRPYRGAIVTTVSPARLAEMFVAMAEIEAVCARQAALAMTARERHDLRAFHAGMAALVRVGDPAAFAEANIAFHERIYAGAHNDLLAETARGLRRRLMPYRRAQFRTLGRLPRSHAEHLAVTLAIERGEAEAAARLMREHLGLVEAAYASFAHAAPPG
ncbi:GntR family transcriptional regulator [Acidibrevibacterium fodinaquatile]|jgi:DNA-binding GntR family transcriptional regulator|uniref:GntR family transcriptional regulator n=1 Tax=Acidibrevibacterium fodinaquatile TaxID=1969806 RepID=UPI000E0D22C8|nr:GntR family transcriptional regulator [Acidibrevibacterium fodinaquatile]